MNANRFSLGDWCLYGKRYGIIQKISNNSACVLVNTGVQDEIIVETWDNIDPVKLTQDILEKNGFIEIVEDIYKCCVGEVYIEIGIYKPMFIYIGASVITPEEVYDTDILSTTKANGGDFFVHDLQHALRLSGIDKKIKL